MGAPVLLLVALLAVPHASGLSSIHVADTLRLDAGPEEVLSAWRDGGAAENVVKERGTLSTRPGGGGPGGAMASLLETDSLRDRGALWDLFIVIPSAAQERERRDAIRDSWAKYLTSPRCRRCAQSNVTYRFVVGNEGDLEASRREAAEFGDLGVLEDFGQQERYTKRSEKTFRSIRYATQNFDFKFLLKCDTDSWVFVDRLLDYFDDQHLWGESKLYAGNFRAGAGAHALTDPVAKWYDPVYPEVTGLSQYPKHAKGAGYILSWALAEGLSAQPLDYFEYVPSEDVAVGFWLMPVHKEVKDIPVEIQKTCAKNTVVDHYITPDAMRERWRTYEALGTPCLNQGGR